MVLACSHSGRRPAVFFQILLFIMRCLSLTYCQMQCTILKCVDPHVLRKCTIQVISINLYLFLCFLYCSSLPCQHSINDIVTVSQDSVFQCLAVSSEDLNIQDLRSWSGYSYDYGDLPRGMMYISLHWGLLVVPFTHCMVLTCMVVTLHLLAQCLLSASFICFYLEWVPFFFL